MYTLFEKSISEDQGRIYTFYVLIQQYLYASPPIKYYLYNITRIPGLPPKCIKNCPPGTNIPVVQLKYSSAEDNNKII